MDVQKETILVPIFGLLIPFHVSTIKNASKTDEEFLRINFITPDSTSICSYAVVRNSFLVLNANKKSEPVSNPKTVRIKELTFRCADEKNLNNCLRQIKELRKRIVARETRERVTADLNEQEKLVMSKGRWQLSLTLISLGRNPRLADIFIRPRLFRKHNYVLILRSATGRKTLGVLEAHTNGVRFTSLKGDNIGICNPDYSSPFCQTFCTKT